MAGLDEMFDSFAHQIAAVRVTRRNGRDVAAGTLLVTVAAMVVALADRTGATRHTRIRARTPAAVLRVEAHASAPR